MQNKMKRRKIVINLGPGEVAGMIRVKMDTSVIVKEGRMIFLK